MKTINTVYIIRWKCDNSEEVFDTQSERNARRHTLENQGYEVGEDFTLDIRLVLEK